MGAEQGPLDRRACQLVVVTNLYSYSLQSKRWASTQDLNLADTKGEGRCSAQVSCNVSKLQTKKGKARERVCQVLLRSTDELPRHRLLTPSRPILG